MTIIERIKLLTVSILAFLFASESAYCQDWANLERYRTENMEVQAPQPGERRVIFMGNSITEGWTGFSPGYFEGKPYLNRGISGQTTPQMLIRFRQDVINLDPAVVIILAGTNDIAGNTGPATPGMIMANIKSMAELAEYHGIKVILCSVLPVYDYPWSPGRNPVENIALLNSMIKEYASQHGHIYADYFSDMVDGRMGLKEEYTYDGVHPNAAGYRVMEELANKAIEEALSKE